MREHSHADAATSPASDLAHSSKPSSMLSRLDTKIQTLGYEASVGDMGSGAAISALSQWQWQTFLPLSAQSLVCSRDEERCKYAIQ